MISVCTRNMSRAAPMCRRCWIRCVRRSRSLRPPRENRFSTALPTSLPVAMRPATTATNGPRCSPADAFSRFEEEGIFNAETAGPSARRSWNRAVPVNRWSCSLPSVGGNPEWMPAAPLRYRIAYNGLDNQPWCRLPGAGITGENHEYTETLYRGAVLSALRGDGPGTDVPG